ncbi:MAG: hypothetical protein SCI25_06960 [Desulfuromonadales bacterium]|nr:hypothetical protein [Desulfuromonadales bacterium]MDW7756112.1 hypothetical protein [Desulfuromonadales bacterium]
MANKQGIGLAVVAFALYIIGGVSTFGGLILMGMMRDQNVLGWGDGTGIGSLFLAAGLCLSILGVLLMRLFRNRGFA